MQQGSRFTHIGVEKTTQRKITLLAKVRGRNIYEMVGEWADEAWEIARATGLVTDAILTPIVEPSVAVETK
jgi:hypothetical protein